MATTEQEPLLTKDLPGIVYVTAIFGISIGSFVGAVLLTRHPVANQIPVWALAPPYGAVYNWFLSLFGLGMSSFFYFVRSYTFKSFGVSLAGFSLVAAVVLIPLLFGLWGLVFLVPLFAALGLSEKKQSSNQRVK